MHRALTCSRRNCNFTRLISSENFRGLRSKVFLAFRFKHLKFSKKSQWNAKWMKRGSIYCVVEHLSIGWTITSLSHPIRFSEVLSVLRQHSFVSCSAEREGCRAHGSTRSTPKIKANFQSVSSIR